MIIAVDFDGTLCENKYPSAGEPNTPLLDALRSLKKDDKAEIILWTCRTGKELDFAVEWCKKRGLIFDAVNENLPRIIKQFGGDNRKVFANIYIDDACIMDFSYDCIQSYIDNREPGLKRAFSAYLSEYILYAIRSKADVLQ